MKSNECLSALAAALLALCFAPALHAAPDESPTATVGQAAPSFKLTDAAGTVHDLAALRGKLVILEWINPECPYIVGIYKNGVVAKTLAELDALETPYVYLTINSTAFGKGGDKSSEQVATETKEFLAAHDSQLPVLVDNDGTVGKLYAAATTPHMYVIDAEGVLRYEGAYTDDSSFERDDASNFVVNTARAIVEGAEVAPTHVKPWGCSVKYRKGDKVSASATTTVKVESKETAPAIAEIGKLAPAFTLNDAAGKAVSLADFSGKIVVLEWLNPDCPYSRNAHQNGVVKRARAAITAADADAVYLTINSTCIGKGGVLSADTVAKDSLALFEKSGEEMSVLIDNDGKIGKLYDARTTPQAYVIDRAGVLRYSGAYSSDPNCEDESATLHVAVAVKQIAEGEEVAPTQVKPWGCSVKYPKN